MPRFRSPWFAVLAVGLVVGCGGKDPPAGGSAPGSTGDERPAPDPDKLARAEAKKRLRVIGKAINSYLQLGIGPAGLRSGDGTVGLSWRVAILPSIGEEALYKEFKHDERWDSEHNKKLVEKMPKVFESPGKPAPPGHTYLRSFVGESAFVPPPPPAYKGRIPARNETGGPGTFIGGRALGGTIGNVITDGASNTLAVVEAAEPVEWTKPDDLPFPGRAVFDPPPPLPKLGGPFPDGFHGLTCDGWVHFFPANTDEKLLAALVTINGGENLGPEWEKIQFPGGRPPEPPAAVPDTLPDAAARRTAADNLRKVIAGVLGSERRSGRLPAGVVAAGGAIGLSWRVQILPYIGEEGLYKQFKLDEPWDSPANKPLVEQMPAVFASSGKPAPPGHTFLRTTQGQHGMVPPVYGKPAAPGQPHPGWSLQAARNLTYVFLVVEAADPVPWTRPDELESDPKKPVPKLGGVFPGGFHAANLEGAVMFVKEDYPEDDLREMLSPFGFYTIYGIADRVYLLYHIRPPKDEPKGGKGFGK
jgi:hypothetical protein